MSKAFPEFLYVRIEEDGGETYLIAGDSPAEIASDVGASYRTGRYKLVATGLTLNQPHYVEDESASKK